jgi:hypothetical protein
MANVRKGGDPNDFDPTDFFTTRDAHEKNLSDLETRVSAIEGKLKTPQDLAAFFEKSAQDSRTLDGVFAKMFCRFLKEHDEVRAAVDNRMAEVDRKFFHKFLKRGWLVLYTIGVAVITLLLDLLKDYLSTLLIHKP